MWGLLLEVAIWVASAAIGAARKGSSAVTATGEAIKRRRGRHRPGIPHTPVPVSEPISVGLGRFVAVWGIPILLTGGGYFTGSLLESGKVTEPGGYATFLAIIGAGLGVFYYFTFGQMFGSWFD